jgi:hypothetical protein
MGLRVGILSFAAASVVALGCGAAPTVASSPPQGMLTGSEYALLSAARLGLESALSESRPNWVVAAQNACLTVTFGRSTPLLASQKASCLGWVGVRVTLATLTAGYDSCARRGPERTIRCRAPLYTGLARAAASAYTADVKAHEAIVERGFTGTCVTALGSTAMELGDAHRLVGSTRRLSADWHLLVGIADGQTPRGKLKGNRVERDTTVVWHDIRPVLRDAPPADLSSCPHQTT